MARTDTFESIVAAVKALGLKWHRNRGTGMLQCDNNNCIGGALMVARQQLGRYNVPGANFGKEVNPTANIMAEALDIDYELAQRIVGANDGRPVLRGDTLFVYRELGVEPPPGIDYEPVEAAHA